MSCPACYLYIKTRLTKSELSEKLRNILCEVTQEECVIKTAEDCHTKVPYDYIVTDIFTLSILDAQEDEDWREQVEGINEEFSISANSLMEFSFIRATRSEGWRRMFETVGHMWSFTDTVLLTEESDIPFLLKTEGTLHVKRAAGEYAAFTTPQRIALLRHPHKMM